MIILFFSIFHPILASLTFLNETTCSKSAQGYQFSDIQVQGESWVTVQSNSTFNQFLSYESVNQTRISYSYKVVSEEYTELRMASKNVYSNGNFITFNKKNVFLHSNFNSSLIRSLSLNLKNNEQVSDVCYGNKLSEIFVLVQRPNTYSFYIFNNSLTSAIEKDISVHPSSKKDKMNCKNQRIFLNFESKFVILALNSSLTALQTFLLPYSPINAMDFQIDLDIVAISCNNIIRFYNYTENASIPLKSITLSQNISSFSLILPKYIIFYYTGTIVQYSLIMEKAISIKKLTNLLPMLIYNLTTNTLILAVDSSINSNSNSALNVRKGSVIYYYSWNQIQDLNVTNSSNALNNGSQSNSSNQSDGTPIFNNNSTINDNASNISNSSDINDEQANQNQSSSNESSVIQSNSDNDRTIQQNMSENSQQTIKNNFQQLNQETSQSKAIEAGLSCFLVVASIKISPQFFISFSVAFDDLWYYKYHLKNYSASVDFFLNKLDIIQRDKLDPWFLQVIQFLNEKTTYAQLNNQRMIKNLNISSFSGEDILFTRSFLQNYRDNIYLTLAVFSLLKLLQLLLYLLSILLRRPKAINSLWKTIARTTQFWIFISSIVQGNLSKIGFDFGTQMLLPSYQDMLQKINLIVCFLLYFIVLFYACSFYPILFCTKSKKRAKVIIMPLKYNTFSYFHQPSLILLKILIRSFIHSFFLQTYPHQILLLFLLDSIFLAYCIKIYSYFYNRIVFSLQFIYLFTFALFDLFFYLESVLLNTVQIRGIRQIYGLITVLTIISCSILITIVLMIISIRKKIKLFLKNRKNIDMPQMKQEIKFSVEQLGRLNTIHSILQVEVEKKKGLKKAIIKAANNKRMQPISNTNKNMKQLKSLQQLLKINQKKKLKQKKEQVDRDEVGISNRKQRRVKKQKKEIEDRLRIERSSRNSI